MDGIINIYKPKGITSYDVIRFIKKNCYFKKKIGHCGTLDPLAEGVLIVCFGKGTKLSNLLINQEKEYITKLLLGIETDTLDIEGKILNRSKINIGKDEIEKIIKSFEGEIEQIPPVVSALKYKGMPYYKLYRKGIIVSPPPRKVLIKKIEILDINIPYVEFKVVCSRGTYIRALCRDIGKMVGCGAVQDELKRTRIGPFKIEESIKLEEILEKGLNKFLIPIDQVLNYIKR